MDTSKEYIKMCDCEEIQNHKFQMGDYLYSGHFKKLGLYIGEDEVEGLDDFYEMFLTKQPHFEEEDVWLPRQDQLQEMTEYNDADTYSGLPIMFHMVWEDLRYRKLGKINRDSGEQIWLAFIMQKHQALWTGSEWDRAHWTDKEIKEL